MMLERLMLLTEKELKNSRIYREIDETGRSVLWRLFGCRLQGGLFGAETEKSTGCSERLCSEEDAGTLKRCKAEVSVGAKGVEDVNFPNQVGEVFCTVEKQLILLVHCGGGQCIVGQQWWSLACWCEYNASLAERKTTRTAGGRCKGGHDFSGHNMKGESCQCFEDHSLLVWRSLSQQWRCFKWHRQQETKRSRQTLINNCIFFLNSFAHVLTVKQSQKKTDLIETGPIQMQVQFTPQIWISGKLNWIVWSKQRINFNSADKKYFAKITIINYHPTSFATFNKLYYHKSLQIFQLSNSYIRLFGWELTQEA